MKTLLVLFTILISSYSQIIRTSTQTDTTTSTNTIKPFVDVTPCPCDYFANSCDRFCCCDTECSETLRNTWTAQELCTIWQTPGAYFQRCPNETILSLMISPRGQSAVDIPQFQSIFCVDYELVPYSGYFYVEDTGTTRGVPLTHSAPTTSGPGSATTYSRQQNIYSATSSTATPTARFSIPKSDPFGFCDNTYSARYLIDLQPSSCTKKVALNTACNATGELSTAYYLNNKYISANPSQSPATIQVTLGNIIRTNTATTPATQQTLAPVSPSTGGCRCDDAVALVEYYFSYDVSGVIREVRADFTLNSITTTSACTDSIAVDLSFAAYFQTATGSTTAKPRSGSPGYVTGLPLLVGVTQTTSVNRLIGGFKVRGINSAGECTTPTNDYTAYRPDMIPRFGLNSSLTCVLPIPDLDALRTYCTATYLSGSVQLFQNFGSDKLVGRFGNANIQYISDWTSVEQPSVALSAYPVELVATTTGSCTIPDEEIYIFYSEFGLASSPVQYIVKVAKRYNINRTFNFKMGGENYLQVTQSFKYIKISSKDL